MGVSARALMPIGYMAKRTERLRGRPMGAVAEVCSVSCCISAAPPDAVRHWRHNRLGFYADETLALGVIPDTESRAIYDLYAYLMLPIAFAASGEMRELDVAEHEAFIEATGAVKPLPSDYACLGWDVVGNSLGWAASQSFECSPLTCNGMARLIATNRYGLIDDVERALAAAPAIARGPAEPGDYYVIQIWRKRRLAGQ
jgi:hypothetical protein